MPFSPYGRRVLAATVVTLVAAPGCDDSLTAAEQAELATLALPTNQLPASPTNRFADDATAAELGRAFFFDRAFSSEGTVACVDCHDPAHGFADTRQVSVGVRNQTGRRHALPVTSAALEPFLLWDGRADAVWRQPLYALENDHEMDFSRAEVAHRIATAYRARYESVFGAMPDLTDVPARAKPGDAAWTALTEGQRDAVQRIFVNVGKAIEAYERHLTCGETRFDRWVHGQSELSQDELDGAARFVRNGCIKCHDGPGAGDGGFHNLGLSPAGVADADLGRETAIAVLVADELNGASSYSDDPAAGAAKIAVAKREQGTRGAFRTSSLRGVTQRARFGHSGAQTNLVQFIEDTYHRGGRGGGGRGDNNDNATTIVGALDPLLDDVDGDAANPIATFLGTLACPAPSSNWLAP